MATKKSSGSRKSKEEKSTPELIPAVPPPDNPLLRSMEFDADHDYQSKQMAEKRLEAIRQTREMPASDEESPSPTTTSTEQPASPTQPDSKDTD